MNMAYIPFNVQIAFMVIGGLLAVASLVSMYLVRAKPERDYSELRLRIKH